MAVFLYLKSGKHYEFTPQIRLTRSKNGTTGTAIFEIDIREFDSIHDTIDPIYGIGLKKDGYIRMADVCHFVWSLGKPIKITAIFIFATPEEKQEFFNYYPYYAINNNLEFFPAQYQEKTLES